MDLGATASFGENYTYDANGNILTLKRRNQAGQLFDDLSYKYHNKAGGYNKNTNQLRYVTDAITNKALHAEDIENQDIDNYTYDQIGNLVKDQAEDIARIEWTVSGKVHAVIRNTGSSKPNLYFSYDAMGNRVSKKTQDPKLGNIKTTYYFRDASGNTMAVYEKNSSPTLAGASTKMNVEQYLYGSSRLGAYNTTLPVSVLTQSKATALQIAGTVSVPPSGAEGAKHTYEFSDHLGNVHLVLNDKKETQSATEYYPFGMPMQAYQSSSYRYGFNGMELESDFISDNYDFGARLYDARLGRWLAVDPKAADAPGWSPYRAFFCNPIRYTDPDGQWEWDATGNLKAQKGDNSYSMAKFLGTSQSNAMQMLGRGGVTANAKGVLNLKEGQSFAKNDLWVGTKSGSGPVVNSSKEATSHYYNGNGAAVDVGDQATTQLLSSDKFQAKHTKITSEQVQATGDFNVDLTNSTFHIGRTNVDYSVTNNGTSSSVNYTLFARDGFWDPNFVAEKTLGKVFDRYKPD